MREIKFRGLTADDVWVHGFLMVKREKYYSVEPGSYISNDAGMPFAYLVRPETVGQYIDLEDKNGKEIYEGDIMKADGTMVFSNPNVTKDIIRIVKKLPSGFTLVANNDFELPSIISNISNYTFWNTHRDWTIIGDIHRNPELLESTT